MSLKDRRLWLRHGCLWVACFLPLVGAWAYFYGTTDREIMRIVYSFSKLAQFTLPLLVWALYPPGLVARFRELFHFSWRSEGDRTGLYVGSLSAVIFLLGGYFLYDQLFRTVVDSPGVYEALNGKLKDFGVYSVLDYLVLSFFIAIIHSFLEEYYWRFYVCAEIEKLYGKYWQGAKLQLIAIVGSSLAFTLHHIVVIAKYGQVENRLLMVCFASFVVFACGLLWASLYTRYRNVYAVWISHIAADVVMLGMGYDVIYR